MISILSTPRAHGTHNNTTDTDTQTRAKRQQEYDKHHRDQPNRAQSASSAFGLGRAARRAAQAARRPPGVSVISRLEDEAAFAARRPALATDRPRPGAAGVVVRCPFLDGHWVVCARAAVVVGVVTRSVAEAQDVSTGAVGVVRQPAMGSEHPPPGQGMAIVVQEAGLERAADDDEWPLRASQGRTV